MRALFLSVIALCAAAVILQFAGTAFKKKGLTRAAWFVFLVSFAVHSVFIVLWGYTVKRLPLSNQFEFASAFAWGVGLLLIALRARLKVDWLNVVVMPMALVILTYAALQKMSTDDLMPALRSAWFGIHIGSAVFSYAAFVVAGCIGLRYVLLTRKGAKESDVRMQQMDYLSYRLVAFGFLFLTIVILTGAIWAEDAWGTFWAWDPKEVWALITWIIYAVYLHLRLLRKRSGLKMAWFVMIAVPVVLFTFAGVNTLIPGLHSYG